jgi:hypothetical protein
LELIITHASYIPPPFHQWCFEQHNNAYLFKSTDYEDPNFGLLAYAEFGNNSSESCATDMWVTLNQAPNIVVEWLTLLLRIRKVPVSNIGPETGYAD